MVEKAISGGRCFWRWHSFLRCPVPASAAETTEARVPVTLTVVNTVSPISCTVPACLARVAGRWLLVCAK